MTSLAARFTPDQDDGKDQKPISARSATAKPVPSAGRRVELSDDGGGERYRTCRRFRGDRFARRPDTIANAIVSPMARPKPRAVPDDAGT